MTASADAHAPLVIPENEVERVNDYLSKVPRARTIFGELKMTTARVEGDTFRDIEGLIRNLENRAAAEIQQHPVQSGDLLRAANYLRTLFPPGHPLYRVIFLKRRRQTQGADDAG
jgi:hypothetical protein